MSKVKHIAFVLCLALIAGLVCCLAVAPLGASAQSDDDVIEVTIEDVEMLSSDTTYHTLTVWALVPESAQFAGFQMRLVLPDILSASTPNNEEWMKCYQNAVWDSASNGSTVSCSYSASENVAAGVMNLFGTSIALYGKDIYAGNYQCYIDNIKFTDADANELNYRVQGGQITIVAANARAKGDWNGDGQISLYDVMGIQQYIVSDMLGHVGIDAVTYAAADVDNNGVIDIVDCQYIQMYLVSKIDSLENIGTSGGEEGVFLCDDLRLTLYDNGRFDLELTDETIEGGYYTGTEFDDNLYLVNEYRLWIVEIGENTFAIVDSMDFNDHEGFVDDFVGTYTVNDGSVIKIGDGGGFVRYEYDGGEIVYACNGDIEFISGEKGVARVFGLADWEVAFRYDLQTKQIWLEQNETEKYNLSVAFYVDTVFSEVIVVSEVDKSYNDLIQQAVHDFRQRHPDLVEAAPYTLEYDDSYDLNDTISTDLSVAVYITTKNVPSTYYVQMVIYVDEVPTDTLSYVADGSKTFWDAYNDVVKSYAMGKGYDVNKMVFDIPGELTWNDFITENCKIDVYFEAPGLQYTVTTAQPIEVVKGMSYSDITEELDGTVLYIGIAEDGNVTTVQVIFTEEIFDGYTFNEAENYAIIYFHYSGVRLSFNATLVDAPSAELILTAVLQQPDDIFNGTYEYFLCNFYDNGKASGALLNEDGLDVSWDKYTVLTVGNNTWYHVYETYWMQSGETYTYALDGVEYIVPLLVRLVHEGQDPVNVYTHTNAYATYRIDAYDDGTAEVYFVTAEDVVFYLTCPFGVNADGTVVLDGMIFVVGDDNVLTYALPAEEPLFGIEYGGDSVIFAYEGGIAYLVSNDLVVDMGEWWYDNAEQTKIIIYILEGPISAWLWTSDECWHLSEEAVMPDLSDYQALEMTVQGTQQVWTVYYLEDVEAVYVYDGEDYSCAQWVRALRLLDRSEEYYLVEDDNTLVPAEYTDVYVNQNLYTLFVTGEREGGEAIGYLFYPYGNLVLDMTYTVSYSVENERNEYVFNMDDVDLLFMIWNEEKDAFQVLTYDDLMYPITMKYVVGGETLSRTIDARLFGPVLYDLLNTIIDDGNVQYVVNGVYFDQELQNAMTEDYVFTLGEEGLVVYVTCTATVVEWNGELSVDVSNVAWINGNGETLYLYVWYDDGTDNKWPGDVMTKDEYGLYHGFVDVNKTVLGVIVSNGSRQTIDLELPANHMLTVLPGHIK